jgi:PIN domain nuclease of toxin-antitoxin system
MKFVTDTHALVWYLQDHPRLSERSKRLFDQVDRQGCVVIPSIVLAELLYLERRVHFPKPFLNVLSFFESESRFQIYPLSTEILRGAPVFRQLDMHDALIVATAVHLDAPLMTQDGEIAKSQLVEIVDP